MISAASYSQPQSFAGQVLVVTGAASGIGAATARRLAREGARVWLLDIDEDKARNIAANIPNSVACQLDVADPAAVQDTFHAIASNEGRIDGLAHVAGVDGSDALRQYVSDVSDAGSGVLEFDIVSHISLKDWRHVMAVNLDGTFHCIRSALNAMIPRRAGAIVTVSSLAALNPSPFNPHYAASKAGARVFATALAKTVAPLGIRMNCVAPGAVNTPMLARVPVSFRRDNRGIPAGRSGEPEEIAAAITFLLSDESNYIIGETLNVNGGAYTS